MSISLIGTVQIGTSNNGGDVTLSFDGSPAEDDLVVLIGTIGNDNGEGPQGPSTGGYTQQVIINEGTELENIGCWTKFMGATPDSQVVCDGGGDPQNGNLYASLMLRGVDLTTPIDVTIVQTTGNDNNPDLSSITTVTDGAWVIAAVAAVLDSSQPSAGPTGYSNFTTGGRVETNAVAAALATKEVATAGSEDPGAFTANSWDLKDWAGLTIAIRPAGSGTTYTDNVSALVELTATVTDTLTAMEAVSASSDLTAALGVDNLEAMEAVSVLVDLLADAGTEYVESTETASALFDLTTDSVDNVEAMEVVAALFDLSDLVDDLVEMTDTLTVLFDLTDLTLDYVEFSETAIGLFELTDVLVENLEMSEDVSAQVDLSADLGSESMEMQEDVSGLVEVTATVSDQLIPAGGGGEVPPPQKLRSGRVRPRRWHRGQDRELS